MLGLRKIIRFEKSHNAENCKRGALSDFFNIHSVAKFQKIEARLLQKKTKNENFQQSLSAEKSERRDPLEFFSIRSVAKYQKMKGGIFGDMKKNCEKKSQSRNNMHKKFWSRARLEPTSFCLADLK